MGAIDHDLLVRKAEALVRALREATGWKDAPDVGKTQSSKAIEVAQSAPILPLFVNWLRYQAAREEEGKRFWSCPLKDRRVLAEALAADLQAIQKSVGPEETMRAVTLYLGYFRRALVGLQFLDRIPAEAGEGGEHGVLGTV